MSGDETEAEPRFSKPKTIRRVRKFYIDPAVSNVCDAQFPDTNDADLDLRSFTI